jgi:hypothetical protein
VERLPDELADTLRRRRERHTPHREILEKFAHGETLNELEREILRRGTPRTKGFLMRYACGFETRNARI